jgi:hypothetical protein
LFRQLAVEARSDAVSDYRARRECEREKIARLRALKMAREAAPKLKR